MIHCNFSGCGTILGWRKIGSKQTLAVCQIFKKIQYLICEYIFRIFKGIKYKESHFVIMLKYSERGLEISIKNLVKQSLTQIQ